MLCCRVVADSHDIIVRLPPHSILLAAALLHVITQQGEGSIGSTEGKRATSA